MEQNNEVLEEVTPEGETNTDTETETTPDGNTGTEEGTDTEVDTETGDNTSQDNTGTDGSNTDDGSDSEIETPSEDEEEILDPSVTHFRDLYVSVLSKIREYDFIKLENVSDVFDILKEYVRPAFVNFYNKSFELADSIDYENSKFSIKLSDEEIEIITGFMVVEYLDANYIRVPEVFKTVLSSKEFNAFSPANHLEKIKSVRDGYKKETELLMVRHSFMKKRRKLLETAKNG